MAAMCLCQGRLVPRVGITFVLFQSIYPHLRASLPGSLPIVTLGAMSIVWRRTFPEKTMLSKQTASRQFHNPGGSMSCAAASPAVSTRLAHVPGGLFIIGILLIVLALVLGAPGGRLGG
jgi:hypothetical protein